MDNVVVMVRTRNDNFKFTQYSNLCQRACELFTGS
jgi:hypothetical protein